MFMGMPPYPVMCYAVGCPNLAAFNAVGDGGLVYTGSFTQLGRQALGVVVVFAFVLVVSYIVFGIIKATFGLRVTEEEEDAEGSPSHLGIMRCA